MLSKVRVIPPLIMFSIDAYYEIEGGLWWWPQHEALLLTVSQPSTLD